MKANIFLTFTGIATLFSNLAQGQFTLSGEVRPRTEYRHGWRQISNVDQAPAFFTDQRTRLNAMYSEDRIEVKIVLQDVRVWGNQSQLNTNEDFATSIHEAYAQYRIQEKWHLKLGRQEISLDDQRFMGAVAWTQQARSQDAALLIFKGEKLKSHIGLAYNQSAAGLIGTNYVTPGNYKSFQYAWANYTFSDALNSSFLLFNNGLQVTSGADYWDNYTQTFAIIPTYKKGKLFAHLNAYYQMGQMPTFPATEVNAYLLGLDLDYQVGESASLGLGCELISGNSEVEAANGNATSNNAFTPFYGTNHKFNGFLDYFYVGNHVGAVGLQDIYIQGQLKKEKWNAGLDVHYFMAAADVLDDTHFNESGEIKAMDSGLGTEIDIYAGFKLPQGVGLKLGYSHFLATETMVALKNTGSTEAINNWAYAMIIFKPTFFKSDANQ